MSEHDHDHHQGNRVEDRRLITGAGCYASDWKLPGQLHGCFVRSDRAHADIEAVVTDAARAAKGVVAVYTGADAVAAGYVKAPHNLGFPGRNGTKALSTDRPVLAHGRVRFVGEAVALVVAESAAAAQDAADRVQVSYRDRALVVDPEAALAPGAPQVHDHVPGNLPLEAEAGDEQAVTDALARSAHVTRLKVEVTRVSPTPMEPRACTVVHDAASGRYTFHVCSQGITTLRKQVSTWSGVPEDLLDFNVGDVGGGFGQRTAAYPEYLALMLAAKATGRPVRWVSTRTESFMTDTHGRGNVIEGALGIDADGRFTAMRLDWINDMGAYLSPGSPGHIRNTITCMTGVYRIPALYERFRVALTNTTPVSSYRGAGRPDIAHVVERLVDEAAAELKVDPAELRRRNFIPPDAFPYKTPTGSTYEYAEFGAVLDKALALGDWSGFAARRKATEASGKLRGRGISTVIENTGAGQADKDEVELVLDGSGIVTVHTVSKSQGHGHETTLGTIVADALGIPLDRVRVVQCAVETQHRLEGNHTGGSRTTVGVGSVCHIGAHKLIEQGKTLAALALKVEPSQVSYAEGRFRADGSERTVSLAELAADGPVSVLAEGKFGSTFPNGCHIVEVEVDPETGTVAIDAYCAVDDCGRVINHAIVEGQLHGGVVQGIGQVLGEKIVYDPESGQILTGSFMDYTMPRAGLLTGIRGEEHPTPTKLGPLGIKGMGESGCTASIPAVTSAVLDALRPLGIVGLDMPYTPGRVWEAIAAAGRAAA